MRKAVFAVALLLSCQSPFDPASYVQGLRVLAVKAQPPEVPPGQMTNLTALAIDTNGGVVNGTWTACTEAALPGYGAVNPDCVTHDSAPYLTPLGTGLSMSVDLPQVDPNTFAPPDASGGLYLPIRFRAQSASNRVDSIYHFRLQGGMPANNNPTLTGVFVVPASGSPMALDEAAPLEVHANDQITMRATFSDDSAEMYQVVVSGHTETVTELLRVSWFSTGGSWTEPITGQDRPDTVWRADTNVPPVGSTIDIYVVGRDERGGTDFLHRSLVLK
jgi:hypothetical protein